MGLVDLDNLKNKLEEATKIFGKKPELVTIDGRVAAQVFLQTAEYYELEAKVEKFLGCPVELAGHTKKEKISITCPSISTENVDFSLGDIKVTRISANKVVSKISPEDTNGGESVELVTEVFDNGDKNSNSWYLNQELVLNSYGNSATINLSSSPLTPAILRRIADELDVLIEERTHLQKRPKK